MPYTLETKCIGHYCFMNLRCVLIERRLDRL